jgi:hypothetical protein
MMAFLKTGPGIKTAEPLKPFSPFWLIAGMFSTFWADSHPESSWTDRTTTRISSRAEFKTGKMIVAQAPKPIMHETLLSGRDLVPPKLLGEWRSMMFLFASAIKITVSISSTKSRIFALIETSEPKTSLRRHWKLGNYYYLLRCLGYWWTILPNWAAFALSCLLLTFKNVSLIRSLGLVACPVQSKSAVEMRFNLVFASP